MTAATWRYVALVGDRELAIELVDDEDGLSVRVDGSPPAPVVCSTPPDSILQSLSVGSRSVTALVTTDNDAVAVAVAGLSVDVVVSDALSARLRKAAAATRPAPGDTAVRAPMPGLVVGVHAEVGQRVVKGTSLVVLQAMKMENDLVARGEAVVKEIHVGPGEAVEQGQLLVTLE